jgi:DNA-3-methyladenine glycosylase I
MESARQDPRIIRNRAKIKAAVTNAQAYLALRDSGTTLSDFLWQFTGHRTLQNRWRTGDSIPAETPESQAMAKGLKAKGFKFCGPTICYAFMQATGMANDHATTCFRYKELGGTA